MGQDLQEQILQERAAEKEPPAKEKTFRTINEQTPDAEDDEYVPYYEHEIFSNKLYEKKLPPMSRKEKIVWSFRMAETNFFL